ncbi:hypothetical protein WA158_001789 [Blastocystis sp. Blastoise]
MSQNTRLYELFGVAPDSTLETITNQYNNLRKCYDAENNANEGVMSFQSYDQCGDGTSYVFDPNSNTNLNESETANVPSNANNVLDSSNNTNLNESETVNLLSNANSVLDSSNNTNLNESEVTNVPLNANDVLDSSNNTNLNESETVNLLSNANNVLDSSNNTNLNESETANVPSNANNVLDSSNSNNLNESETANLLLNTNDPHWIEIKQSSEIIDQTLIAIDPSLQTNNPVTSETSNDVANTSLEHLNESSTVSTKEVSLYDEFWKFQDKFVKDSFLGAIMLLIIFIDFIPMIVFPILLGLRIDSIVDWKFTYIMIPIFILDIFIILWCFSIHTCEFSVEAFFAFLIKLSILCFVISTVTFCLSVDFHYFSLTIGLCPLFLGYLLWITAILIE